MLQPGSGSVREEKGKIADDEVVVVCPSQLACQPIIRKPQLWPCLPRVLGDGSQGQRCPGVVDDTALDVPGPMTGSSNECSACPLLLDVLSELHKSPCFLVDLGLHLADLLELCVLTPPQGLGPQLAPAGCQREMRA
jgi:hypothetical protein